MKRMIVNCDALRSNIGVIKRQAEGAAVIADLSGDGQGVGLVKLAELLRGEGVASFAVSEAGDAERLRSEGYTEERIIMLRSTMDTVEINRLADCGAVCTIGSYDAAIAANSAAEKRGAALDVMIKIDSGEGHYGFLPSDTDKMLNIFRNMPGLAISGVYTRLSSCGAGKKLLAAQLSAFDEALRKLSAAGADTGVSFALDSYSLFKSDSAKFDAVCVGSAIIGRTAGLGQSSGLERVGFVEAEIEEADWFPAGAAVGLGKGVKLRRSTKAAVVSVGWVNGIEPFEARGGLFRRLRPLTIMAGSKKVRLIGQVGPHSLLADITGTECGVGDRLAIDCDPRRIKYIPVEYR